MHRNMKRCLLDADISFFLNPSAWMSWNHFFVSSDGAVYFTGTWPALKTTYDIVMKPLNVGEGMENLEITTTSRSSATLPSNLPRNHEQVCAAELAKFFKGLLLDLEGAELRYQSMQIVPGSSSEANNSPTEEWLKLRLNLRVRQFPPLNIQF